MIKPYCFNNINCCICNKPFTYEECINRHDLHEPECDENDCDCDLPCHEHCCPECNEQSKL